MPWEFLKVFVQPKYLLLVKRTRVYYPSCVGPYFPTNRLYFPKDPWDWYIYLLTLTIKKSTIHGSVNMGKYTLHPYIKNQSHGSQFHRGIYFFNFHGSTCFFHGQATTSGCNGSTLQVSWWKKNTGLSGHGKRVMKKLGVNIFFQPFFFWGG